MGSSWTLGPNATLTGRLPHYEDLALHVRMRSPRAGQKVWIRLDDGAETELAVTLGWVTYRVPLVHSASRHGELSRIVFRVARTAPLGTVDPRDLGVNVDWVRFEAGD